MDKNLRRICYIGNIASQSGSYHHCTTRRDLETTVLRIENNALSKGAVTRALRVNDIIQFPSSAIAEKRVFTHGGLFDKPTTPNEYDYVVGIGMIRYQKISKFLV
jgi:hypothetical protein